MEFAVGYYCKDGKPTAGIDGVRSVLQYLCKYNGRTSVEDFGPLALAALRNAMMEAGLSRGYSAGSTGKPLPCSLAARSSVDAVDFHGSGLPQALGRIAANRRNRSPFEACRPRTPHKVVTTGTIWNGSPGSSAYI